MGGGRWGSAGLRRGRLGSGVSGSPPIRVPEQPLLAGWPPGAGQLSDRAHAAGIRPFPGQTLASCAGPAVLYERHWPTSRSPGDSPRVSLPLAGSESVCSACAYGPAYELLPFFFLTFEGFGPLARDPFISVIACPLSLAEGARLPCPQFRVHPSEGGRREVTPRLPPSLWAALLCS